MPGFRCHFEGAAGKSVLGVFGSVTSGVGFTCAHFPGAAFGLRVSTDAHFVEEVSGLCTLKGVHLEDMGDGASVLCDPETADGHFELPAGH